MHRGILLYVYLAIRLIYDLILLQSRSRVFVPTRSLTMSHYDFFSSQYQGTAPAVLYYTCPWTVTPAAKNQLEVKFTIEIEVLGLVSSFSLLSYPISRSSSVDMPSLNPDLSSPYPVPVY